MAPYEKEIVSDVSDSDDDCGDSESSASQSQDFRLSKRRRIQQTPADRFGLKDDCPPFPELVEYAKSIAGSTLTAAETLLRDKFDAVINWEGGRHHALRDRCSGFCYVQDVVLGIDHLRRHGQSKSTSNDGYSANSSNRKPRVMYLDLDVHFGDAPAAAFKHPYRYSSPMTPAQKRQPKPHLERNIPEDVPAHDYWHEYSPSFQMHVESST
ncbi:hypothetical protein QFC19_005469 [Naganishia cerealis]|uniref:Uncharacterized protein n=1 Tax=Naganishia cerealis TaxID=610337 RepID=A0ACC2VNS0_9TREE|nr:hypothetical protein QFC19_005469 [Naganishia cerealis]